MPTCSHMCASSDETLQLKNHEYRGWLQRESHCFEQTVTGEPTVNGQESAMVTHAVM